MPDLPDNGLETTPPDDDRIRAKLVALRDASEAAFTPPPMRQFRSAARRRSRSRAAILAVAVTAAAGIGGTTLALAGRGPDVAPRPTPTVIASSSAAPSPSGPASPPPSAPSSPGTSTPSAPNIRTVDWRHVTLVLPPNSDDPDCPTGRTTTNGDWTTVRGKWFYIGQALAVGDLTGDGSAEAVMDTSCSTGEGSGDGSGQLLVVTWRDGAWTGLGYVGPRGNDYPAAQISGQRLNATIKQRYGPAEQSRTYRWNGQRFIQVAGPTTFPSAS
jgi:hypothetical protein